MKRFFFNLFYIPIFLSSENYLPYSINEFATSLYLEGLSNSSNNELFSPFCLFNGLSMVYIGADSYTADEMAKVLHLQTPQEELALQLTNLSNSFFPNPLSKTRNPAFSINISNGLWIDTQFPILESYQNTIKEEFSAEVQSLDFSQKEQTAFQINQWISTKTNEKIKNLLSPEDIVKKSKLILASTLYFKGTWSKAFEKKDTHLAPFYKSELEEISVNMMEQTYFFPYYETEEFQLLLLPFSGENQANGKMAAFFLLPKKSLSEIEQSLNALSFRNWLLSTKTTSVFVQIPRFEETVKYDLSKICYSLGMRSAFSYNANFSKITGNKDLFINKAVHKVFFSIDENGVTAAAATAIGMGTTSIRILPPPTPFIANHPFLFGIVDLKSNVMLFLGKMIDPQ